MVSDEWRAVPVARIMAYHSQTVNHQIDVTMRYRFRISASSRSRQ
jgi:hypothetical protein